MGPLRDGEPALPCKLHPNQGAISMAPKGQERGAQEHLTCPVPLPATPQKETFQEKGHQP